MEDAYRFAPAGPQEEYVFGAAAPGWHSAADVETAVRAWIEFMRDRGMRRVCCLLPGDDRDGCRSIVQRYRSVFGEDRVLHAPIPDRRLGDRGTLSERVLPFLEAGVRAEEPTVVHGLSGLGRTGQVLAAWLVYGRDYDPLAAIETVERTGRFPAEAAVDGPASERELLDRLASVG